MSALERSNFNIVLRVKISILICSLLFFVLILRLWYLQIMKGDYFRLRSENNRLRTIYVQPPRGVIYDRNKKILVKNRPGFNIELVSEDSPNPKETVLRLAKILNIPENEILPKLSSQLKRRRYEPKLLLKDVSRDIVAKILSRNYQLPGIQVNVIPTRDYVHKNFAAHVLGYIREVTKEQLDHENYQNYRQGDLVGQYGLEARFEPYLQGKRGVRAVIVDATGTRIGEAFHEPEKAGQSMVLTLDYDMQLAGELALADKRGAIVALDANTGEILTMVSKPDFDPNMFAGELKSDAWQFLGGKEKRLSNRSLQGGYPPGSVFKIFMAIAALAEKVTDKNERIFCPGFLNFAGRNYRCHKHSGHGSVNLAESLIQSCDVFFYTVGNRLGVDRINRYAKMFSLGNPTRLDLAPEHPGLIPSTEWKRKAFRKREDQKWYAGETLSVAIGQGAVVVNPLQVARALATLVNGGRLMKPFLVKEVLGPEHKTYEPSIERTLALDSAQVKLVMDALEGVVNDPKGTGHRSQLDKALNIIVGGKTGTAQVASLALSKMHKHLEDHAWFAGYAPTDKPEIVVVALVENGGHGGAAAAPLVRQVMEAYFKKKLGVSLLSEENKKETNKTQVVENVD
jgi:penicillin-binding protein 2